MFPKFFNPIEVHSIGELIVGALFSFIFWPVSFLLFCLNMTLRFISQSLCNYYFPGQYVIADGVDSVFGVKLHGSSKSYIYGYKIIRGEPNIDIIRSRVERLTQTKGYERLSYSMTDMFGYFHWDTKVILDVTKNVRLLDNFNTDEIVDEEKLTEICSTMVGTACDEGIPQWEVLLIPKYKMEDEIVTSSNETKHYAIIIRFHHAYCDGISFVLLTNNILADSPGELPINPMRGFRNPMWIKAYIWAKILIVGPLNFFVNLAVMIITPSNFRVDRYSNSKILSRSSPIELNLLKKIRHASGTSITAITLAAVYGAVYKTHLRKFPEKQIPKNMHLGTVGVMLPYSEKKRLSNQFTMWRYVAPVDVDNPKYRLAMAYEEVRRNASQPDALFNFYMQRALGSLPVYLHKILFALSGTPVMLSNVPGYTTAVEMFGGKVVDVSAWIPLVTTTGVGVSSQTYCGQMRFSAITDPQLFSNAKECREFLNNIVDEIRTLADAYGICTEQGQVLPIPSKLGSIAQQDNDTLPRISQFRKDSNDNEESVHIRPSLKTSESPHPDFNDERQCRIRNDFNANVIAGTTEEPEICKNQHRSTPVARAHEKVI